MTEKTTFSQILKEMRAFNNKHGIKRKVNYKYKEDKTLIHMTARVVISQSVLRDDIQFTEKQRTYEFDNYNKALTTEDLGYSIFAVCPLDKDCMRIEGLNDNAIEQAEIIEINE